MRRTRNLSSRRKNHRSISKARRSSTFQRGHRGYHRTNMSLESLEPRNLLTSISFQQGVNGYVGTNDTVLFSIQPTVNFGTDTAISVDQQDLNGARQGLLKFDDIMGSGPNQIPLGSTINSATLTVSVFNESNSSALISAYRMKTDWDQDSATWNSFGAIGGVQASEGEAEALPDYTLFDPNVGTRNFDVTTSLKHWAAGEGNFGWLFQTVATNGWDFNTSEGAAASRPLLTVDYTAPTGAGTFQFLDLTPTQTEGDSGTTTAMLTVARLGGTAGTVSVDYAITAGTGATSGVDFEPENPLNHTLTFGPGITSMSVPVIIHGDTDLEGNETVNVTLSGATGGATVNGAAGTAVLTIADDDIVINEVLAHVSTGTDTNREYIELAGTPNAAIPNGYFFVIFEGEEEENGGTGSGIADMVVDLGGQTFGSDGLLVITGHSWAYTKDPATNQMMISALDALGGGIEDSSQTYAIIRSPSVAMVQGTDYDTVGSYESNATFAVGAGVGILDQLPAGAQIIDSVGVVEGGSGDRDRVATLQYPGVHIHEPIGNGDVTPDAITRRLGNHTPNSIGPWYNGEIETTAVPLVYAPDPRRNVVTPPGAQITPGAANLVRTVGFSIASYSVDESGAGTVTLNVTRSGDDSVDTFVTYNTVNGTAVAGPPGTGDYTAATGTVHFAPLDNSEDIVITILPDSIPEGFEKFSVTLSSPTVPFQIVNSTATVTINDANVLTKTFQDGVDGYNGTADVYLDSTTPDDAHGFATNVIVDDQVGTLTGSDARPTQGLLRFDDLFGSALNQVPVGSQIFGAFLTVNVQSATAASSQVRLFRMLQSWDEGSATWTDPQGDAGSAILNGVTPDDLEATAEPDAVVTNPSGLGLVDIPLNVDTLQAWANGTVANNGWAIVNNSGIGWAFESSDDFLSISPQFPKLTLLYTAPSGQGSFRFSNTDYKVNENGTASIAVERVGGGALASPVTLNWNITPGTGSLADITGPSSGTVVFSGNDDFKTITIPINNDSLPESNETLNVTLTPTAGETILRSSATLLIRDNDFNTSNPAVLLNELYINDPGNDGGHEFVELAGTPNIGMGSLYLYVVDGNVGPTEGESQLVIDLGSYSNGSTGFSLIKAQNTFDFRVPSGTTDIGTPLLDIENLSNDTATFFLLYSPNTSLATGIIDYDWDNDGSLELPPGVVTIDSIANKDNGATDQTYGPAANVINSLSNPNLYVPDAISRKVGNTTRSSASAWYHGDLIAVGDDPLVYLSANSLGLAAGAGTAVTPGEANTGTPAQSPLVSLTSITPNLPSGTVTLNFNGPISQYLKGAGATAVTITSTSGSAIPGINASPTVTGLGTSTLTLAFTGASVVNGILPAGNYKLNFIGNQLIGHGRAVDTADNLSSSGSDFSFTFTQPPAGDVNLDRHVNGLDIPALEAALADVSGYATNRSLSIEQANYILDVNHSGSVDNADLQALLFLLISGGGSSPQPAAIGEAESASAQGGAAANSLIVDQAIDASYGAAAVSNDLPIVPSAQPELPVAAAVPVLVASQSEPIVVEEVDDSFPVVQSDPDIRTTVVAKVDAPAAASVDAQFTITESTITVLTSESQISGAPVVSASPAAESQAQSDSTTFVSPRSVEEAWPIVSANPSMRRRLSALDDVFSQLDESLDPAVDDPAMSLIV
jgi:hypothetical protein